MAIPPSDSDGAQSMMRKQTAVLSLMRSRSKAQLWQRRSLIRGSEVCRERESFAAAASKPTQQTLNGILFTWHRKIFSQTGVIPKTAITAATTRQGVFTASSLNQQIIPDTSDLQGSSLFFSVTAALRRRNAKHKLCKAATRQGNKSYEALWWEIQQMVRGNGSGR